MPATAGCRRDHAAREAEVRAIASRSQFTNPARATTGARATMSASQGRRRTVSPVLAMVQANSADMPATLTPKKVGPPPPSIRVTQAARYMKTPVSTGYSSTCWPGPGSRR